MTRIPANTIEDTPAAGRPPLAGMTGFFPARRLRTVHAPIAHARRW